MHKHAIKYNDFLTWVMTIGPASAHPSLQDADLDDTMTKQNITSVL